MPDVLNGGVRIHYEIEGQGPFLILQTGAAGDASMWRQAGYLNGLQGFTRILVDHRGHGSSDRPSHLEQHRMESYVNDILALMDSLGIDQTAFLGYSDGGRVGFELALSHPDRITCLASLGSVGSMDEEEIQGREELGRLIRAEGWTQLIHQFEEAEGIRFPAWLCDQFLTTDAEMFALELIGWETWHDAWSRMPQIQRPVLIIVGENEDPNRLAQKAASTMPNGKAVTLPQLGHIAAFLAADDVLKHLVLFLSENLSGY